MLTASVAANPLTSLPGSVEMNTPHITKAHQPLLSDPNTKRVLEIASGFLDHCISYARQHETVEFQPTECNDYLVGKLEEKRKASDHPTIKPALRLDALNGECLRLLPLHSTDQFLIDDDWESLRNSANLPFDVVTVTNLLNVSPWSAIIWLSRRT